jgi:hypothetical protein
MSATRMQELALALAAAEKGNQEGVRYGRNDSSG